MTKIVITKKDNEILCVECSEHTGFAESGKDIVCAGVSSITQTAILGVEKLTNIKNNFVVDEKKGYLKFELYDIDYSKDFEKAQVILKTMLLGLEDLEKQYPKYIKLEDKQI